MQSSDGGTPVVMVTGLALPSYLDGCRCGARKVDVFRYLEHDHLRGQCTACGVFRRDWIPREIIGLEKEQRATRFNVSLTRRWEILERDKFTCVHCGNPAPRSSEVLSSVQRVLVSIIGEEELVASSSAHARSCITCGQMLPGVLQTLSHQQLQRMTADQKRLLFAEAENRRLTIDHIFPESILEMNEIINGKTELKFVSQTFLVTACMSCNLGKRATLEPWSAVEQLLRTTALRGRASIDMDLAHAKEIHFRISLRATRKVS